MSANLPWLHDAQQQFAAQRRQGMLPHAMLLPLAEADGGVALGQYMAALALCNAPLADEPCGHCKSCQLVNAGNHPDFHLLQADGNQIKVEQVRGLCQSLMNTAQQGGFRVALILRCERMTVAAANALLKTLEEPGAATLLVLQSDRPAALLPTVVSRCQQVKVARPSAVQLNQWLHSQYPQLNEDLAWCLPIAGGALQLAQYVADGYAAELKKLKTAWQKSLESGHLSQKLSNLSAEQLFDALKLLYQVLQDEMHAGLLDPLQQSQVAQLAARVMRDNQQLMLMANVNYLALCQSYVLEYKRLKK
ncbi:DNA polymerase III subunit delta' [Shewanella fodinae]|uniref:DNA polymerase III subunit delta' n=1 Tax=Shewanella fodinae TaxID=552357 RepID=UPI0016779162|nr:DNA polymerase III subunit delta' [Shewanella fodinae]MCL2905378.1 DNA polymerase III subunit delta' [Shewanella fodinae]GGY90582.1 DNA polymerase III subunit delta' [Shewanella fodinae]